MPQSPLCVMHYEDIRQSCFKICCKFFEFFVAEFQQFLKTCNHRCHDNAKRTRKGNVCHFIDQKEKQFS